MTLTQLSVVHLGLHSTTQTTKGRAVKASGAGEGGREGRQGRAGQGGKQAGQRSAGRSKYGGQGNWGCDVACMIGWWPCSGIRTRWRTNEQYGINHPSCSCNATVLDSRQQRCGATLR